MNHHYVVSVQQPTTVTHCEKGHFLSASSIDVLVAKTSKLELYSVSESGLMPICVAPIYGRVTGLCKYHPSDSDKDRVIIFTSQYDFTVVSCSEKENTIETIVFGNIRNKIGKAVEISFENCVFNVQGDIICLVDPANRVCLLYLYIGSIKIVPLTNDYSMSFRAFDIHIPELGIRDIKLLPSEGKTIRIAIIYDEHGKRNLKVYTVDISSKQILNTADGFKVLSIPETASTLIPISQKDGGLIICSNTSVAYYDCNGGLLSQASINLTSPLVWDEIGDSKFLVADKEGLLFLVMIDEKNVLSLTSLGRIDSASVIRYLDNRVIFIGNYNGPSRLLRITSNRLEELYRYDNCGPIIDMVGIYGETKERKQLLGAGGFEDTTAMLLIRDGVKCTARSDRENGMEIDGTYSNMVTYLQSYQQQGIQYLLASCIQSTHLMEIQGTAVRSASSSPFLSSFPTLLLHQHNQMMIQVTPTIIRVLSSSGAVDHTISKATAAYADQQYVVVVSEKSVICYQVEDSGAMMVLQELHLKYHVSCAAIGVHEGAVYVAVCQWICNTFSIYSISSDLATLISEYQYDTLVKSVVFSHVSEEESESQLFSLLSFVDGTVRILDSSAQWKEEKCFHVALCPGEWIKSTDASLLLLVGECSCCVYHKKNTWFISRMDYGAMSACTVLQCKNSSACFMVYNNALEDLEVITIDSINRMNTKRVEMKGNCIGIAYQKETETALFLITPRTGSISASGEVHLVDTSSSSLPVLSSLKMKLMEYPMCACSYKRETAEGSCFYYVVGTAFVLPNESEPTNGRIMIIRVNEQKECIVENEIHVKGGCLSVCIGKELIIASVSSDIQVYTYEPDTLSLKKMAEQPGGICIIELSMNEASMVLAVGDILRSVTTYLITSVVVGSQHFVRIEFIAKESMRRSITALDRLDEDKEQMLVGDANGNLLIMSIESNDELDRTNPRKSVVVKEGFHLDDQINCIIPYGHSAIDKHHDEKYSDIVTFNSAFCTVSGRIGLLGYIKEEHYSLLKSIENAMNASIKPVGCLNHETWKHDCCPFYCSSMEYFIDGDLIESFLEIEEEGRKRIVEALNTIQGSSYTDKELIDFIQSIQIEHELYFCLFYDRQPLVKISAIFVICLYNRSVFERIDHNVDIIS